MAEPRLSTHVLDAAQGIPAANLQLELYQLLDGKRVLRQQATTNSDGRTEHALLLGPDMKPGEYELVFHAGDYLVKEKLLETKDIFLDLIPIRFHIQAGRDHYHVPLLLSPFSYSTYRGS